MKQSTKLLSMILALVMAFSCMTVIGSAVKEDVTKDKMTYDSVDDAILSAEQAATVLFNYLDASVMPGLGVMDLSVLGELDLTSIDSAVSSIYNLLNNSTVGFLAVSVTDLKNLTAGKNLLKGVQRSGGDLNVAYALFNYLGADGTVKVVKKAPYGLLTNNGISLGSLLNGIVKSFADISEINGILTDINGYVTKMVYDLLIHGSYKEGYENNSYPSAEDLGGTLPAGLTTVDSIIDMALAGLLTSPQDYEWDEVTPTLKNWDMDSYVMPTFAKKYTAATAASYLSLSDSNNSIFALLDKVAPYAIYDLGINPLNNNLKKALFDAVEADAKEIDVSKVPTDAKTAFEADKEDGTESYITYISYDKIFKSSDGEWYYTTLKNSEKIGSNGEPETDKDGNVVIEKVRKYYRINTASANSFFDLINWDWNITAPNPVDGTATGAINEIDYAGIISQYGSITQALNHLVYIVSENALSDYAREYFNEVVYGDAKAGNPIWKDGATSATEGNSTVFLKNIERIVKFLLAEYADKIFGEDSPYVAWEYSDVQNMTLVELIAHIGPTFFEDAMPQLIMPKDENGLVAFHDGVQILEFGAIVIREFMTEITPDVNYDAQIFAAGTLTSAGGRQFASHSADEWFNLILNMGMDIAYTYLNQITNFNTAIPAQEITETRWQDMLDKAILWAVGYVSSEDGANGVLKGISKNEVNAISGPLNKLSYIFNTILPLGFVNGCTTQAYDLDVQVLFNKVKDLVQNFNLDTIVSLFGRNTDANTYNILNKGDIVTTLLDVVDNILALVLRAQLLGTHESVNALLQSANLSTVIANLLYQLKASAPALLTSALPVVCKLIPDLGGEQELGEPNIGIGHTVNLNNGVSPTDKDTGAVKTTFKITNGSTGLWRGYKDASGNTQKDNHYSIKIKSVTAHNFNGTNSDYITSLSLDKDTLNYSESATVTYNVANVTQEMVGALVRFDVVYNILDEDGNVLAGKDFTKSQYVWMNYNGSTDEGTDVMVYNGESGGYINLQMGVNTPQYVDLDNIESSIESKAPAFIYFHTNGFGAKLTAYNVTATPFDGITPGTADKGSSDQLGAGTERKFPNILLFKDGTYACEGGKKEGDRSITVTGASFNRAAWEAANKKEGDTSTSTVSFDCTAKKQRTGSKEVTFKYYSSANVNLLTNLVNKEANIGRVAAEYHTDDAIYYADRLLRTTEVSKDLLKETASVKTAWIDDDKNVYAESEVTNKKTTNYKVDGKDTGIAESVTGTVVKGDTKIAVKKVTELNGKEVWDRYLSDLEIGMRGAWQGKWNNDSLFNQGTLYKNLYISTTEVQFLKLTDLELAAAGAGTLDTAVDALEAQLDAVEAQYSDTQDYTDYMMYRWNRYNSVRKDARSIVDKKKAAAPSTPDSKFFPYSSVTETEIMGILSNSENASIIGSYVDSNGVNFISALLEDYTAEEMLVRNKELANAKSRYANVTALDVAQASNLLNRIPARLIARYSDASGKKTVVKTHLANEIASANAMIGKVNVDEFGEPKYTDRSWNIYIKALEAAEALNADANATQMQIFDTKWALLIARNGLVLLADEADYSELEELIAQANNALAHQDLYENTAKDFGAVLAELGFGYDAEGEAIQVALANGDKVNLFPGSAEEVNHNGYDWTDQKKIDRAATALKEALAKLKFKGSNVGFADGSDTVKDIVLVEADEKAGVEEVKLSSVAKIGAKLDAAAVKALFTATGSEDAIVSADVNYSAAQYDIDGFVGTNATITYYKTIDSVKVPVATIKLVVEGDVNGDGVVNVLDASIVQVVSTEHAELEGAYLVAGNMVGDIKAGIDSADYREVVNKALA